MQYLKYLLLSGCFLTANVFYSERFYYEDEVDQLVVSSAASSPDSCCYFLCWDSYQEHQEAIRQAKIRQVRIDKVKKVGKAVLDTARFANELVGMQQTLGPVVRKLVGSS